MEDIFNTKEFNDCIIKAHDELKNNIEDMIQLSNNSIEDYIRQSGSNAYDIGINVQEVMEFIDSNYASLNRSCAEVFNNVNSIQRYHDDFNAFYELVHKTVDACEDEHEKKTLMLASVIIVVMKNNCCQVKKKMRVLLNSMCKFPEVNQLINLTENVLQES